MIENDFRLFEINATGSNWETIGTEILHNLQHCVGHGERNIFLAEVDSYDWKLCKILVGLKLMKTGFVINEGQDQYFYATHDGARYGVYSQREPSSF